MADKENMGGSISVMVTDERTGQPAAGLRVQVYWVEPQGDVLLRAASTDAAGTTDKPMVSGAKLSAGTYRLVLHAGDYLQQMHSDAARCLDVVPVVFVVDDAGVGRRVTVMLSPTGYAVSCV